MSFVQACYADTVPSMPGLRTSNTSSSGSERESSRVSLVNGVEVRVASTTADFAATKASP